MATLIIPDNIPLIELARLAEATGKRLRYSTSGQPPKPEDTPDGHHLSSADSQLMDCLADQHRNAGKDAH